MNRRRFLSQSSAAAACAAFPTVIPAHVLARAGRIGANDRVQVGFIGVGGRARAILKDEWVPKGQVVAIADCFLPRCHQTAEAVEGGHGWSIYQSYQEMLEKEKLDAVFVETTTHARARAVMHVLQSGRDVYAEKPLTLTIAEGRALVDAVKATGRILQTGTQQRSMPINQYASKLVRDGAIGNVREAITFNFWGPIDWMPRAAQSIPEGLDWDVWCDQTDLRAYHPSLHYGWSNYIEYDGGGQSWGVTGWGTHSIDQVQCALGTDATGPVEIIPDEPGPAGKVTLRYENGTLLKLHGAKRGYEDLGAIFVGDHGRIDIRRGSAVADPPELLESAPPDSPSVTAGETRPHIENFLECLQTRATPNADVETAHRATTVCHLVNIVRTLGRTLSWNPQSEQFVGDEEANTFLSRPRRAGYELPRIG